MLPLGRPHVSAGSPVEVIDKFHKEIMAGLADPGVEARLADLGGVCLPGSPASGS
jgi:hypothetical protein